MNSAINLALLILGTTGTCSLRGESRKKTDQPLLQRITRRGWLALTCTIATLILGVAREVRSNATSVEVAAKRLELEANFARTTTELRETLAQLASVDLAGFVALAVMH